MTMKNRGILTSELRSDGKLSIHISEGDIWMTRPEITAFLGVFTQSFVANLREVLKNGELQEYDNMRINDKGTTLYSFDVVLTLIFRCKGGYCRPISEWIKQRIKKPIVEHRQPIIISLGKGISSIS